MKINQVSMGSPQVSGTNMDVQAKKIDHKQFEVNQRPLEKIAQHQTQMKVKNREEANDVLNEDMLERAVEQANKSLEMYHRRIDRSIHEVTKTVMYTIKDTITNEVIQEFPPKKIQDMIAKMWELAGLFVDEKG